MLRRSSMWAVSLCLVAGRAGAAELGSEGDLLSVDVHAFASQGFILTTSSNYLADNTKHGSPQFSEIGINFTKGITDKLRMGVQLFAQDLGPTGNYNAKMDWFYLDYRWQDWLGFRAGRVKIPFGLYNEVNDIDAARVPILLPQSVYPLSNRDFLLAQTGAELYGYARTHSAGALDYRVYYGTIFFDTVSLIPPGSPYQLVSISAPYVTGGRLLWETPIEGVRVGGSLQVLRLDLTLLANAKPLWVEVPAVLAVGSADYSFHDLALTAEYSRWRSKVDSSDSTLFPSTPTVSERAYGMATYRLTTWLQAGAYYSLLFPDVDHRSGRANVQHDVAATVRLDINTHWLVKLEGHYMAGTAGLNPMLNDNTPRTALDRYWGAFFAKTTAYF
jgi:hypothetical protein